MACPGRATEGPPRQGEARPPPMGPGTGRGSRHSAVRAAAGHPLGHPGLTPVHGGSRSSLNEEADHSLVHLG